MSFDFLIEFLFINFYLLIPLIEEKRLITEYDFNKFGILLSDNNILFIFFQTFFKSNFFFNNYFSFFKIFQKKNYLLFLYNFFQLPIKKLN